MDYVTRQFINLTKKFRKELPKLAKSLRDDIQEQTKAIREARNAYEQSYKTAPVLRADLQVPHPIEVQTDAKDKKTGREWYKLTVETLTLLAVVAYAIVTVRMWREMIHARHQAQFAVEATQRSADTALKQAKDQFRAEQRPYIWLAVGGMGTPELVTTGNKSGHLSAKFHLSNYGKSPAIDARQDAHIAIGEKECSELRGEAITDPKGSIVQPGDSSQFNFAYSRTIVSKPLLDKITAGTVPICIFGRFEYTDINGPDLVYSSDFCWMPYLTIDSSMRYCKPRNRIR
jgi:hypothetical protein